MKIFAFIFILLQMLLGSSVSVESTLSSNQTQPYPCLAYVARDYKLNPSLLDTLFVSDFYSNTKLSPANAFFVTNSKYKSTCSQYPIFAFSEKTMAEKFVQHYGGAIRDFEFALFVALKDLEYDMPNSQISNKQSTLDKTHSFSKIEIPSDAKCPVCNMLVAKYPKWSALIETKDGHQHYFDGVKDMMEFYFAPQKYHHDHQKEDFIAIFVSDYYTLEKIDAKNAFFVAGSNIYGPMGDELIPFKNEADAKTFSHSHHGQKIYQFHTLSHKVIMDLDK